MDRPLVFISHHSQDCPIAKALADLLSSVSCGMFEVFYSGDVHGRCGIDYGAEWYNEIVHKLNTASAVICLLTERSLDRPWILFEAGWAKGRQGPVVFGLGINVPADIASSGPFAHLQNCTDEPASLKRLLVQLLSQIPGATPDEQVLEFQISRFKEQIDDALEDIDTGVPDLNGEWEYEVKTSKGEFSHAGHCKIAQDGLALKLDGYRVKESHNANAKLEATETFRHWYSTWAQFCHDDKIRMDYRITLDEFIANAVCSLNILDDGKKLIGDYHLLPPFHDSTLNAKMGHIIFIKTQEPDIVSGGKRSRK